MSPRVRGRQEEEGGRTTKTPPTDLTEIVLRWSGNEGRNRLSSPPRPLIIGRGGRGTRQDQKTM